MVSCTNEMDELVKDSSENVSENLPLTCSCSNDTIDWGELVCLEETEELLNLKRRYEENHSGNHKVQVLSTALDDFFSSNVYAIRELPITIKVRSVASGSTVRNAYLFCDGAKKRLHLAILPQWQAAILSQDSPCIIRNSIFDIFKCVENSFDGRSLY